ncbi:hypothetical protein SAMN05421595_2853 [Austwickia chelonae]|uniref:Uncharacterized protein n=1 Tax=Austwickia chelonae NBRC 105200 TaxID=1184607 RepID=K6VPD8_9MICO|nr:hypothetical protein [Austwickia chelonae]GAB78574.1 hypothetical protein AUCHE_12_00200 [Austwickia chelonae NBRC 105200]SEW40942.1 hypothetical protein SAMN05421595_2853 [Austwickia chelonae]
MSIAVHRPGRPEHAVLTLVPAAGEAAPPGPTARTDSPDTPRSTPDDPRPVDELLIETAQLAARLAGLARLEAEILSL